MKSGWILLLNFGIAAASARSPEKAFTNKYQRWCKKHGYNFSEAKAHAIYEEASGHIGVMPKSETTRLLVEQAVFQLRATSAALAALKQEM